MHISPHCHTNSLSARYKCVPACAFLRNFSYFYIIMNLKTEHMYKFILTILSCCIMPLAAGAQSYRTAENIPYRDGDDSYITERCRLDVYYQPDKSDTPVVVWFHGGGLTGGNKFIPEELKNSGLTVVAVNYRLMPKAELSECIDDAAAAVAWTFRHIAEYGGDPHRIYVCGHSAGGYLTNMIGLDKRWLRKYGIDADSIAALVPFSGHAISHFAYREAKGMKPTQPSIDEFAPLYYVRADAPPLIIVSGDRELEMLGRYEENAYFRRMLQLAGHKDVTLYEFDGYGHDMCGPGYPLLLRFVREREAARK